MTRCSPSPPPSETATFSFIVGICVLSAPPPGTTRGVGSMQPQNYYGRGLCAGSPSGKSSPLGGNYTWNLRQVRGPWCRVSLVWPLGSEMRSYCITTKMGTSGLVTNSVGHVALDVAICPSTRTWRQFAHARRTVAFHRRAHVHGHDARRSSRARGGRY